MIGESFMWFFFCLLGLIPIAFLVIVIWILDKLVEFTEIAKKTLVQLVPLALSILIALWTTDPTMPPLVRGFLWFLLLFAFPLSIWAVARIATLIPGWQQAARNCEKATQDSITTWQKRLGLSKKD